MITLQSFKKSGFKKLIGKLCGAGRYVASSFVEKEQKEQIFRRAVSLVVMVGITVGSVVTAMAATKQAAVVVDGKETNVVSLDSEEMEKNPYRILKRAGVSAAENDEVGFAGSGEKKNIKADIVVSVKTAKCVTVAADGKEKSVLAHYGDTVADALRKAGVVVGKLDNVSKKLSDAVSDGMSIAVKRNYHVTIADNGKTTSAVVGEGSVSNALDEMKISLKAEDLPEPGLKTSVSEGMKINIIRVSYKDVTSTQAVPYSTVKQKDCSVEAGTKNVKTHGQNGVRTVVTRQKICNGKVADSSIVSSSVTKQPVDEVVVIGTKQKTRDSAAVCADGTLVDQNGQTVSYRKVYHGTCTCYCTGTTTSTGLPAAFGRVAVNPNLIPYGSRLYICSPDGSAVYGYAVAADTGGAAMSGRIIADLYYPSYSQCVDFGSRTMNVYVLD